jgi:hypothetical protein
MVARRLAMGEHQTPVLGRRNGSPGRLILVKPPDLAYGDEQHIALTCALRDLFHHVHLS